jgi:RNA polymerase sigma factor (sigma-70 family)
MLFMTGEAKMNPVARRRQLAHDFEKREHLHSVAYRMLGSVAEADDAVQEAWLRLDAADTEGVLNLRGWLTTVVGRVCLDMLRTRRSRREEPADDVFADSESDPAVEVTPEDEAVLADSVGLALLVVLETLTPRAAGIRIARHVRPAVHDDRSDRRPFAERRRSTCVAGTSTRPRQGTRLVRDGG